MKRSIIDSDASTSDSDGRLLSFSKTGVISSNDSQTFHAESFETREKKDT